MRRSFENCKKTVLVDCFDTLLLRQEHPYQVLKRWCICVHRLYPEIEAEDLFQKRMDLMQEIRINENGVYQMYRILAQNYKNGQTEEELFIRDLAMLEIQCDISTVKPNHRLIKKLKKIKKNTSLYCVSDYHYTAGDLRKVLEAHGIDFLDGVYSSADHKMTKQKGTLYPFILQELNLSAGDCMMIGDNRISDIRNAEKAGIRTVYQPQIVRQNYLRVMNRLGKKSFRHDSVSSFGRYLWRSSADYREYALVFYAFCARLYEAVWEAGKCVGGGRNESCSLQGKAGF